MKKKVITVLSVIAALAVISGAVFVYFQIPHALSYDIESIKKVGTTVSIVDEGEDFVEIKKSGSGDFKVLMFTDLHFDGKNRTTKKTVKNLVANIQSEKPDLVILGGDSIEKGLSKKRTHQLAQIFEQLGVYWAAVLGNHEGDGAFAVSRSKTVDIFASYAHCLMRQGKKDVDGNGNYVVTVLNQDDSIKECFFLLDTHDSMSNAMKEKYGLDKSKNYYDGLYSSQVSWYTEKLSALKEEKGDFRSIAVIHIPLPQYRTAAETESFIYGDRLEEICESGFDSGFFDAVKSGGSTTAVFCGHDHVNTFGVLYKGILLSYIQPSGYSSYTAASKLGYKEKDWLQGYTVLNIMSDGKFTQAQHRNSENSY